MRLNAHQRIAYNAYDTSLMPIPDLTLDFASKCLTTKHCGDGLFAFVMAELAEVEDDAEAIRRITTARLELQEIERALFRNTKPCPSTSPTSSKSET